MLKIYLPFLPPSAPSYLVEDTIDASIKEEIIRLKGDIPFYSNEIFEIAPIVSKEKRRFYTSRYIVGTGSVPIYTKFKGEKINIKIRYSVKNHNKGKNYFIGAWEMPYEGTGSVLGRWFEGIKEASDIKVSGWHILPIAEEEYKLTREEKDNFTSKVSSSFWPSLFIPPEPDFLDFMPKISTRGKIETIDVPPFGPLPPFLKGTESYYENYPSLKNKTEPK